MKHLIVADVHPAVSCVAEAVALAEADEYEEQLEEPQAEDESEAEDVKPARGRAWLVCDCRVISATTAVARVSAAWPASRACLIARRRCA